jgi:hypothetical protein
MSAGYFTSNGGFAPQGLKSGEVVMQHPTRPIRRPWAACRHTTRWSLTAALAALVIGSAGSALAATRLALIKEARLLHCRLRYHR